MTLKIPLGTTWSIDSGSKMLGAGGWTPLQLPNLLVWLDADDESTLTEVSGRYSEWRDKSGNGNDVSQATSAERPYSGRTIGGLNSVDFRLNEALARTDALGLTGNPDLTIIIFTEPDDISSHAALVGVGPQAAGNTVQISTDSSFRFANGNKVYTSINVAGEPAIYLARRKSGDTYTDGVFRVDRQTLTNVASELNPAFTPNILDTYFGIGAGSSNGANAPVNAAISEVIVCNAYLTDKEIAQVETYLQSKYLNSLYDSELFAGAYAKEVQKTNPIRFYRMFGGGAGATTEPDLGRSYENATHDADSDYSVLGPQKDIVGGSRDVSGANYTSLPALTEISNTTAFSIGFWVFNRDISADQWIFSTDDASAADNALIWYNLVGTSDNVCYSFGVSTTLNSRIDSQSNSALQGTWQYVVCTKNGAMQKIYVDGILSNTRTGASVTTLLTQAQDARIGTWRTAADTADVNIADFAVWDRELTAREIANLYASATVPNLVTGNSPFDLTDGWTPRPNVVVTANQAGAPDGTSTVSNILNNGSTAAQSYIQYQIGDSLKNYSRYTYSAWLKADTISAATVGIYNFTDNKWHARINVDLTTGAISPLSAPLYVSSTSEDAGNGWWRVSLVFDQVDDSGDNTRLLLYPSVYTTSTTGDAIDVWNVQCVEGDFAKPVLDPRKYPNTAS